MSAEHIYHYCKENPKYIDKFNDLGYMSSQHHDAFEKFTAKLGGAYDDEDLISDHDLESIAIEPDDIIVIGNFQQHTASTVDPQLRKMFSNYSRQEYLDHSSQSAVPSLIHGQIRGQVHRMSDD